MSPRDNSREAYIDRSSVIGILDYHSHFAAGALDRRSQGYDLIGRMGRLSVLGQVN
jgi:hypothetical protein